MPISDYLIETPNETQLRLMLCIVIQACGGEVIVSGVDPGSVRDFKPELVATVEPDGKQTVKVVLVKRS
jgi:hypothetical protein